MDPLSLSVMIPFLSSMMPELFSLGTLDAVLSFLGNAGAATLGVGNFANSLLQNPASAFNASTYSNYWQNGTVPTVDSGGSGLSPLGFMLDPIGSLMAREDNKEEAHKARQLQLWMFKNQTQVRVKDMKKAGMNPILSVSPGAGASMPSGVAQAQFTNPFQNTASSGATFASALSTLFGMKNLSANYQNVQANTALTLEKARNQEIQNAMDLVQSRYLPKSLKYSLLHQIYNYNFSQKTDYYRKNQEYFRMLAGQADVGLKREQGQRAVNQREIEWNRWNRELNTRPDEGWERRYNHLKMISDLAGDFGGVLSNASSMALPWVKMFNSVPKKGRYIGR